MLLVSYTLLSLERAEYCMFSEYHMAMDVACMQCHHQKIECHNNLSIMHVEVFENIRYAHEIIYARDSLG